MKLHLNHSNFFKYYIFHPRHKSLKEEDRRTALMASLLFGFGTLGLGYLVCLFLQDKNFVLRHKQDNPEIEKTDERAQSFFNLETSHSALDREGNSIHRAIQENNLARLSQLLSQGIDINQSDRLGNTPLHSAFEMENLAAIRLLLEHNADLSRRNFTHQSAFDIAATKNNIEITHLLKEFINSQGNSLLHLSSAKGEKEHAQFLLAIGIDVNAQNHHGDTPLHFAALNAHKAIVEFLVFNQADPAIKNHDGVSCLNSAIGGNQPRANANKENERLEVVKYLLAIGDIDLKEGLSSVGGTPLHQAAICKRAALFKLLVENGFDIKAKDSKGFSPFYRAIIGAAPVSNEEDELGRLEIVRYLLNTQAIDIEEGAGSKTGTALHQAALKAKAALFWLLIKHGANLKAKTKDGLTPFYFAIGGSQPLSDEINEKCRLGIIKFLMRKRAANLKECCPKSGGTPLHQAALSGRLEIIKLLLKSGANPNAKTSKGGFSPLYGAVISETIDQELRLKVIKYLLKKGAEIDEVFPGFGTVLVQAAALGNLPVVKFLVEKGADIHARNNAGLTPYCFAAYRGRADVVDFFISRGIVPAIFEGFTASLYALEGGHIELARDLKKQEKIKWCRHKKLTHRFGIGPILSHEGKELKLEGFALSITMRSARKSLEKCKNWIRVAPSFWNETHVQSMLQVMDRALKWTIYCANAPKKIEEVLKLYREGHILTLPLLIENHGFSLSIWKNIFITGDRALNIESSFSPPTPYPHLDVKKIENHQSFEEELKALIKDDAPVEACSYNLFNNLTPSKLGSIQKKEQHGNVCAWVAAKSAIEESLFMSLFKELLAIDTEKQAFTRAKEYARKMYGTWVQEDKLRYLKQYLVKIPQDDPYKVFILACLYHHLSQKRNSYNQELLALIEKACPEAVAQSQQVVISGDLRRQYELRT